MTYKVHLPADDQTPRWVGAVWFPGDPHVDPDGQPVRSRVPWVITRCGQSYSKPTAAGLQVTEDLTLATCGRCLHSYGAKHLGLGGRAPGQGMIAPMDTGTL